MRWLPPVLLAFPFLLTAFPVRAAVAQPPLGLGPGAEVALPSLVLPAFRADLAVGAGLMRGDTTYQIGGRYNMAGGPTQQMHFPLSELEFPLDVAVFSARGSLTFLELLELDACVKKSITRGSGKMKDSDWLATPDVLDIYSESDTSADALIWDARLRFRVFYSLDESRKTRPRHATFLGIGYMRQDLDFSVSDLDQWYPSDPAAGHVRVAGEVLKYSITYSIPFLEIAQRFRAGERLEFGGSFGYSPIVSVKDEDQHLLRSKVNVGRCKGDAYLFAFDGRYKHPRGWFLSAVVDYTRIAAHGAMDASISGVYNHTIEERITSTQINLTGLVGYEF